MIKGTITSRDQAVWDVFFVAIVSMAHCHPGAGRTTANGEVNAPKLSLEDCADIATRMVELRKQVGADYYL